MIPSLLTGLISAAYAGEGAAHAGQGVEHGAHAAEGGIPWDTIGFQSVTLLVFVGFLVYVARRPLTDTLRDRALGIRRLIEEAGSQKKAAEARFAEIDAKLASLDQQVRGLRAEAEADAAREADKIRERAAADAIRIRETAERTIREEAARARQELRGEAVRLSIGIATDTLKRTITADDQDRLSREFLAAVAHDGRNGGANG